MTTVDISFKKQGGEHPLHNLSYFCKICGRSFLSGRALGGHMRAHASAVMAPDTLSETEFQKNKRPRALDDKSMEEKDDEETMDGSGSNLMFALRTTPSCSRPFADRDYSFLLGHGFDSKPIDSSLNCDMSGKEFRSWKGLFSHVKCHSDTRQDSGDAHLEESLKHETQDEEEGDESDADIEIDCLAGNSSRFDQWMNVMRSKRPRYAVQLNPHEQFGSDTNNEEEVMAMCLLMLASGVNTAQNPRFQVGAKDLGSSDLKHPITGSQLPKHIRKKPKSKTIDGDAGLYDDEEAKKASYKCTTCNKVFHSYQALGGHRASHNKVKGSISPKEEENESLEEHITDEEELIPGSDSQLPGNFHESRPTEKTMDSCVKERDETRTIEVASYSGKKSRVHECSICHSVFASGQALGGHKSCHRVTAGASDSVSTISSNKGTHMQQQIPAPARAELLDLNLPALVDDDCNVGNLTNLVDNAVDSHRASYAESRSPNYLQSRLMGCYPKQGLLYNRHTHLSKDDEAGSDFPVRAQTWLHL